MFTFPYVIYNQRCNAVVQFTIRLLIRKSQLRIVHKFVFTLQLKNRNGFENRSIE